MIRRVLGASAVLAVALGLAGCAEGSGVDAMAAPAPEDLVGRWVTGVSYDSPEVPFLLIADDGTWTGSDGCNGAQGEWSIDGEGALSVEAGMSTQIACDGVALPTIFSSSAMASIDGGRLRLFDDAGATTVKLARSTTDESPTTAPDPAGE
ncbi:META domain-containing protein [Rathayibacter sp. VKM Ac-2803]|uniref:META domain-containing protein n=1 Tax=unclassified Rathayibacter TaxID=2609250 RepID=UPI001359121E|nr:MULTISPECIES: META domain-containing protein [unclassified Rathayibacter]MWV50165.1 META domain-containing protein [Rathayibacter sp. VKM Ac-2803]MWV58245.1 META domain-containing protein [Rathayibacter sp. VKM Ac-2754]